MHEQQPKKKLYQRGWFLATIGVAILLLGVFAGPTVMTLMFPKQSSQLFQKFSDQAEERVLKQGPKETVRILSDCAMNPNVLDVKSYQPFGNTGYGAEVLFKNEDSRPHDLEIAGTVMTNGPIVIPAHGEKQIMFTALVEPKINVITCDGKEGVHINTISEWNVMKLMQ